MKKILITSLALSLAATATQAQVVNQWNFNDTAGTGLGSVTDSEGSASFTIGTNGTGTLETNGSGLIIASMADGRVTGNADIADVSTGVYQLDLTGVTFTSIGGGSDDLITFGTRSSFVSGQFGGFGNISPSSSIQTQIVVGNEDNASGIDFDVIDNNTSTGIQNTAISSAGTWDFRILIDYDNDTADYFYQVNGSGYNNIVSQQFNAATGQQIFFGSSGFSSSISADQLTWSAVPEPSAYALIAGFLALGWIMIRRR